LISSDTALDANILLFVLSYVVVLKIVMFKYMIISGDKSSHAPESDLLPSFGEILFHTDVENGCSSMTWKYREPRIINRLSVMPVPFSISAEYDMIDHNFEVFLQFTCF